MKELADNEGRKYPASDFSNDDIWNYWTMQPTEFGEGLANDFPRGEESGSRHGRAGAVKRSQGDR
jgi:hypothetical protein